MKTDFALRGLLTCLAAALPAFALAAQPAPIEIKTVSYKGSLPYVVSGSLKRDARVNHAVFIGMTGQPAPAKYTDKVAASDEQDGPGISEISYSVTRSDERVLAFELDYEGCGGYCEHHWDQYIFDAATGRGISSLDILTPAGRAALVKQSTAKRLAEYSKAIAALNKEAAGIRKKQRKQDDEEARISETIVMYRQCMESMRAPDYARYYVEQNLPLKIEDASITLLFGRCSNHAMRALDEVGDQNITFEIADLAPHLTAYGKYLLLGGPNAAPKAAPFPFQQFLQGHVGFCSAANFSRKLPYSADSVYNSPLVRCNTITQLKIKTQTAASRNYLPHP